MPVKKKAAKKTAKKKTKKAPAKKTYVCTNCGAEVVISRRGLGITRLVCCGEVMKPKRK